MRKAACGIRMTLLLMAMVISAFDIEPIMMQPYVISDEWPVQRPYHMVAVKEDEPETVDPAWTCDSTSIELISNVYETLIRFDRTDIKDEFYDFVPCLATDRTISEDGLTYTFSIREGVPWHNSTYGFVTAQDIEYSFERAMVHDKAAWSLYEPLLGTYGANLTDPVEQGKAIDDAITVDGNTVGFHLKRPDTPYAPYTPFTRILAQPMCSHIVCKEWCIDNGDFPGFNVTGYNNWVNYHDLDVSPFEDPEPVMMGTGPYMLDYWENGVEYSLIKFDDYWGGWPAPDSRGWVVRVTVKFIPEWAMRKVMVLSGDADIFDVPFGVTEIAPELFESNCELGVECTYPLWPLETRSLLSKFEIYPTSPFLGSGFDPADPYTFGEDRIPVNFFADIDVRKAFAYSFDGIRFLEEVYQCEAVERPTPVIPDLPYYNSSVPIYEFSKAKAEAHFRHAWGGLLWDNGFSFTFCYKKGEEQYACELLEDVVESLNPKFHVECRQIPWGTYMDYWVNSELPIFSLVWCADYPDPHNFVYQFMHSEGGFARNQHIQYGQSERKQIYPYGNTEMVINNTYVDALIEAGLTIPDGGERERIYDELQQIYHEECLSVFLYQPIHRHFQLGWVNGWYYNRISCEDYLYFYTMWKEDWIPEDINEDGSVNIIDISSAARAFGSDYRLCEEIHPRWDSRCDLNCDQAVNIMDIAAIAKKFGYAAPPWTPP